ncbi:hypothetical protein M0Q97_04780 [Candidatus Dojkabacteria bacterium]|jgi:hypothetical protein|nr:hypothetical protein [Candidatus Dojkabacteria bacterium]
MAVIAVDFDGTCVTHEYPNVGKDIGAVPVLKKLIDAGHQLILFSMRSDKEQQDAVEWFANNNIPLYGININPDQISWTKSNKAYAQHYIDDAGIGCPLIFDDNISGRPFVNWKKIEELLKEKELI